MRIELPQVGESVTEGVIGKWLRRVGDSVEKYDPLVEVVTDKVNMEMPSPVSGVLTHILAHEGETVPMGAPIAEIEVEGEVPTTARNLRTGRSGDRIPRRRRPRARQVCCSRTSPPSAPPARAVCRARRILRPRRSLRSRY